MVGESPSAAPSKSSASASSGSACMLQKAAVKNCDNQASKVECRACMDTGPKVGWKAGVCASFTRGPVVGAALPQAALKNSDNLHFYRHKFNIIKIVCNLVFGGRLAKLALSLLPSVNKKKNENAIIINYAQHEIRHTLNAARNKQHERQWPDGSRQGPVELRKGTSICVCWRW
jgi:hypothetical protein